MPKVRGNAGEKWGRVTPQRTDDYIQGVQNPRTSWQQATTAAEGNYQAGVQQAIAEKRFGKGVAKAGDQKWQSKAVTLGGQRFGPGVQEGVSAYQSGFAPYQQVIESTQLPPRFPKGDPRNLARVGAIATALRNKKIKG